MSTTSAPSSPYNLRQRTAKTSNTPSKTTTTSTPSKTPKDQETWGRAHSNSFLLF